jgi:flagellar motor protein MotB
MACFKVYALPTLALCVALTGCKDNKAGDSTAVVEDHNAVAKQLDDQGTRLNEMGLQLQRERDRADALATQLAECQENAGSAPPPATGVADASQFNGIPGVEATMVGNEIRLTIASNLLFDSGKTTLRDASKKSLDQVATRIKDLYPDRQIMVVGHTDSDPIRKSTYATNYHLGFERAFRVREYLGKKGLSDQQMALASYGPDLPQGSKDRSRRVEIVVKATEVVAGAAKSETPRNASAAASKSATSAKTSTAKGTTKAAPAGKAAASGKHSALPTK